LKILQENKNKMESGAVRAVGEILEQIGHRLSVFENTVARRIFGHVRIFS
jgi:hypothetical protein